MRGPLAINRLDYAVKGIAPVSFAAISWGFAYFIRKDISTDFGPFTVVTLYCASALLFLFLTGPKKFLGIRKRLAGEWTSLIVMALCSATIGGVLMNVGLEHIDLGLACVLERFQVIFTVGLASIFLGEKMKRLSAALGILCVLAGCFLVLPQFDAAVSAASDQMTGIICVLGAAFVWAVTSVLGRKLALNAVRPTDISAVRATVGIVTTLPFAFIVDNMKPPAEISSVSFTLAVAGGVAGSALGFVAYCYGLKIVSAAVSGLLETLTPLTALILGAIFFRERLSNLQLLCAAVLLASLVALIFSETRQTQSEATEPFP